MAWSSVMSVAAGRSARGTLAVAGAEALPCADWAPFFGSAPEELSEIVVCPAKNGGIVKSNRNKRDIRNIVPLQTGVVIEQLLDCLLWRLGDGGRTAEETDLRCARSAGYANRRR